MAAKRREREATVRGIRRQTSNSELCFVYFTNAQRVPPGQLKAELNSFLPRGAVRCIDFIRSSVMELLTTTLHRTQVVASLKALGFRYEENLNAMDGPKQRNGVPPTQDSRDVNAQRCKARVTQMLRRLKSPSVQEAYTKLLGEAADVLAELENSPAVDHQ